MEKERRTRNGGERADEQLSDEQYSKELSEAIIRNSTKVTLPPPPPENKELAPQEKAGLDKREIESDPVLD